MAYKRWSASEPELVQMRRFNKKLAWLPCFKIRNRVTPRLIQALLRVSQHLKKGPVAESRLAQSVLVHSRAWITSRIEASFTPPRGEVFLSGTYPRQHD